MAAVVQHSGRALADAGLDEVKPDARSSALHHIESYAFCAERAHPGIADGAVRQARDEVTLDPKRARLTATFASAPPKLAFKVMDCSKRSNAGALKRSKSSPKQTVFTKLTCCPSPAGSIS
jgi:hypothetical protein